MRQKMIVHMLLAVLCIIVLGLGTNIHTAEEHLFGEITITITGSGHRSESGGGDRHTTKWENSYEHSLNVGCRIMVCEAGGELKVLGYDPYGTEQWMKKYAREEDHVICPLTEEQMKHNPLYRQKNYPPNIKKPGNSEMGIERFNASIDYGNRVFIKQKTPRVEFGKYPNGIYSLSVSGEVEMFTWLYSETTKHYPCDNKDVKDALKYAPDMPSSASFYEDGGSYISGPSEPQVRPFYFTAEKIGLQGSKTIYETIDKENGYRETAIARWEFKRTSTSCNCEAIVDMAKGEVKADGEPVSASTILDNPQQISTGADGRAQITFGNGDRIAIGANNKIDLSALCKSEGSASIYMKIMSIVSILTDPETALIYEGSNAHAGVRGELLPIPGPFRPNIRFASYRGESFAFSTVALDQNKFSEVMPSPEDIERSAAALLIEPDHSGSGFKIWVLKGKFQLKADTGFSTVLEGPDSTAIGQMPTPYHIKTAKRVNLQASK